jgi:hypothetical protein
MGGEVDLSALLRRGRCDTPTAHCALGYLRRRGSAEPRRQRGRRTESPGTSEGFGCYPAAHNREERKRARPVT